MIQMLKKPSDLHLPFTYKWTKGTQHPHGQQRKMPNNFETAKQQQMQQRTTHGEIKIEVS